MFERYDINVSRYPKRTYYCKKVVCLYCIEKSLTHFFGKNYSNTLHVKKHYLASQKDRQIDIHTKIDKHCDNISKSINNSTSSINRNEKLIFFIPLLDHNCEPLKGP